MTSSPNAGHAAEPASGPNSGPNSGNVTIDLSGPIMRGETAIGAIRLRAPRAGDLRGLSMVTLGNGDYASVEKLLGRISDPMIAPQELAQLEAADLMAITGEILNFLLPRSVRAGVPIQ